MTSDDRLPLREFPCDRVLVLIDASNLFYAALKLEIQVDYTKLLNCLVGDRPLSFAYYYSGIDPHNQKQQAFLRWMQSNGYRVVTKEITTTVDGHRKADLTVEMAVDMLLLSERCDVLVLVSGNGNLAYAIQTVASRGVKVELVGLRDMTSDLLMHLADRYIDLESLKDQICKGS